MITARELAEDIAYVFSGREDYDEESAEEFIVEVTEMIEDYTKGLKCQEKKKAKKRKS